MKISKRLAGIAGQVPRKSVVSDIGTDHALLPIYLISHGFSDKVVAGDLNEGPLDAARRNVTEAGLDDKITLQLGFGLGIVQAGTVDVAIIAGMGGSTIKHIISQDKDIAVGLKRLVLQPMNDSAQLRCWLVKQGWRIYDEDLVKEDERIYEIITAVRGKEQTADETVISVGPRLVEKKHPLLSNLIKEELTQNKNIITALRKSSNKQAMLKLSGLQERNRNLERILECL